MLGECRQVWYEVTSAESREWSEYSVLRLVRRNCAVIGGELVVYDAMETRTLDVWYWQDPT